jgi:ribonuclease-3
MIWSAKSDRQLTELSKPQLALLKILKLPTKSIPLFLEALTHPSYAIENQTSHYQRLEFLGDAILNTYSASRLFSLHPEWSEGELTRARASIISEESLSKLAASLNIHACIRLGRGEHLSGGALKNKILADVMESIIAVVYLSKGQQFLDVFLDKLQLLSKASFTRDHKSELQNIAQGKGFGTPVYRIIKTEGQSHNPIFHVQVVIKGNVLATGTGHSKKEAEQNCAQKALETL